MISKRRNDVHDGKQARPAVAEAETNVSAAVRLGLRGIGVILSMVEVKSHLVIAISVARVSSDDKLPVSERQFRSVGENEISQAYLARQMSISYNRGHEIRWRAGSIEIAIIVSEAEIQCAISQ